MYGLHTNLSRKNISVATTEYVYMCKNKRVGFTKIKN